MKNGLSVTLDKTAQFFAGVEALIGTRVMVGVPAEKTDRRDEGINKLTNAALAYIHTNGAPEVGIPARPFLEPGIRRVQGQTVELFKKAGQLALSGQAGAVDRILHAVGLINQASARSVITEGIPPPLAAGTVERRIGRRKSKKWRADRRALVAANVDAGLAPGAGLFTPLIDSAQLLKSVSYVLRKVTRS